MKLIIDLDEDIYKEIVSGILDTDGYFKTNFILTLLTLAFKNSTPIPDNATNGDVIKAMFPTADISLNDSCFEGVVNKYGFDLKWWNSPYQKGGE